MVVEVVLNNTSSSYTKNFDHYLPLKVGSIGGGAGGIVPFEFVFDDNDEVLKFGNGGGGGGDGEAAI